MLALLGEDGRSAVAVTKDLPRLELHAPRRPHQPAARRLDVVLARERDGPRAASEGALARAARLTWDATAAEVFESLASEVDRRGRR